ncbi:hypothetical protein SDC9_72038 [bioreactor metagenome]|uniref:Peptidase S8/S53 domain-containing protein n=1 Tax=bioreactor metagenome TaxID=1076179 RepID=A0A644YA94_9ZZZZ
MQDVKWAPTGDIGNHREEDYGIDFYMDENHANNVEETVFETSHGTRCAGIIAANDNAKGIIGIAAMAKVKLMSLRILDIETGEITGEVDSLIEAITFAENNGASVCNISASTKLYSAALESVIKNSKMLFVVSAGNGNGRGVNIDKSPVYPAAFNFDNVITVANLNYDGQLNKTSNFGVRTVDLAAPGTCIYTTNVNNTYSYSTGTSMAAPMVTGVSALIFSLSEDIPSEKVKEIIVDSVTATEALDQVVRSSGMLNGANAIESALKYKTELYN